MKNLLVTIAVVAMLACTTYAIVKTSDVIEIVETSSTVSVVAAKALQDSVSLNAKLPPSPPRAVLVLDVSGSMVSSDESHLQSEAVRRFYEIYRGLSSEILEEQKTAQLAVILFSTIGQLVDWKGDGNPWLVLDSHADTLVDKMIETYLGSPREPDPRQGQDTDYLCALRLVDSVIARCPSQPLVVFMTDGKYDPHAFFSPLYSPSEKSNLNPTQFAAHRALITSVESGNLRMLDLETREPIFDRSASGVQQFPVSDLGRHRSSIQRELDGLLEFSVLDQATHELLHPQWAPILFGVHDASAVSEVSAMLGAGSQITHCSVPEQLVTIFAAKLARWLRLDSLPVPGGAEQLQIPSETQAFAAVFQTPRNATRFALEQNGSEIRFEGHDRIWSCVATDKELDGTWRILTDGGYPTEGILFHRSRYQWVALKRRWVSGEARDSLDVSVYLYSLVNRQKVDAGQVFSNLPSGLHAVVSAPGFHDHTFNLTHVTASEDQSAYRATTSTGFHSTEWAELKISMEPFQSAGIAVTEDTLRRPIAMLAWIEPALEINGSNQTSVSLMYPMSALWLRRLLGGTAHFD